MAKRSRTSSVYCMCCFACCNFAAARVSIFSRPGFLFRSSGRLRRVCRRLRCNTLQTLTLYLTYWNKWNKKSETKLDSTFLLGRVCLCPGQNGGRVWVERPRRTSSEGRGVWCRPPPTMPPPRAALSGPSPLTRSKKCVVVLSLRKRSPCESRKLCCYSFSPQTG